MKHRHILRGRALIVVAALSLFALPTLAQVVVSDVRLPETRQVEGKTLQLNGAGLRTKVVKLYVAGLYLEEPATSAQEVMESKQTKRVELHVLRDLSKKQVGDTIREGFEKNSAKDMGKLQERLSTLTNGIGDVKRGEVFSVTYVPGKGTTIDSPSIEPVKIEGEDFANALFAVWLGENPAQEDLKRELLKGGPPKTAQR